MGMIGSSKLRLAGAVGFNQGISLTWAPGERKNDMRTGDEVTYTSNVHKEYTGQKAVMVEFNLEQRMTNLQFSDGNLLWVFWDEFNAEN